MPRRGDTQLTDEDRRLLAEILEDALSPKEFALKVGNYYHDLDRAERTPKDYMYLHMGMLVSTILKLRRRQI